MTDGSRKVYLGMARLFLLIGAVVGLLGLGDQVIGLDVFRGSPIGTALFLLAIGGLLHWTATTAERRIEQPDEGEARERD